MRTIIKNILSLLWFAGCQADHDPGRAEAFGDTFSLESSQEAQISGIISADDLEVVVENITDSRCPTAAPCVWAGNARVKLSLSQRSYTQSLTLCIGACHAEGDRFQGRGFIEQDTALVTVGSQAYEVILKAVLPYPSLDRSPGEQEAVLEINH